MLSTEQPLRAASVAADSCYVTVAEHIYALLYLGYKANGAAFRGSRSGVIHRRDKKKKSTPDTRARVFLFPLAADITCVNQQELKSPECFLAAY